jgi:hypothetical protein
MTERVDVFHLQDGSFLIDAEGVMGVPSTRALDPHITPQPPDAFRDFSIDSFRILGNGTVLTRQTHSFAGIKVPIDLTLRSDPRAGIVTFHAENVRGTWTARPESPTTSRVRLIQELRVPTAVGPLGLVMRGVLARRTRRAFEDISRRCSVHLA